jgi:hypothetical protein
LRKRPRIVPDRSTRYFETMTTAEDLTRKLERIREAVLRADLPPEVMDELSIDLEEIEHRLEAEQDEPLHSVLELRGLGKEIWQDIDVDEYIRQERESWG